MTEHNKFPYKTTCYILFLYSLVFLAILASQSLDYKFTSPEPYFFTTPSNNLLFTWYFSGLIIITLIAILLKNKAIYLGFLLIAILLTGSITINFLNINNEDYFPPYVTTEPGDFYTLGKKRWKKEFPYKIYYTCHDEYLLQTINVNPEIENFLELSRINGFGVYLNPSKIYPASLTDDQFDLMTQNDRAGFVSASRQGLEFRLYGSNDPNEDILLTTYKNIILFIPQGLISE